MGYALNMIELNHSNQILPNTMFKSGSIITSGEDFIFRGKEMNYKYNILKLFVSDHLQGIEISEHTNVQFYEDREYGSDRTGGRYIVTDIMELDV